MTRVRPVSREVDAGENDLMVAFLGKRTALVRDLIQRHGSHFASGFGYGTVSAVFFTPVFDLEERPVVLKQLVGLKTLEIRFRDVEYLSYRRSVREIIQNEIRYLRAVAVSGHDIRTEFSGGFRIRLRPASGQYDDGTGVLPLDAVEEGPVLAVCIFRDGAAVYDDDIGILKTVCSDEAF